MKFNEVYHFVIPKKSFVIAAKYYIHKRAHMIGYSPVTFPLIVQLIDFHVGHILANVAPRRLRVCGSAVEASCSTSGDSDLRCWHQFYSDIKLDWSFKPAIKSQTNSFNYFIQKQQTKIITKQNNYPRAKQIADSV